MPAQLTAGGFAEITLLLEDLCLLQAGEAA
jgi:hypothetical protein